jgi:hypothetical protein
MNRPSVATRTLLQAAIVLCAVAVVAGCDDNTAKAAPPATAAQLKATIDQRLSSHDYQAALVVSRTLVTRFPDSPEASAVSHQLQKIQAGAEKQHQERTVAAEKTQAQADRKKASISKEQSARFEQCRAKLKQAHQLELLYDLNWSSGSLPRVVVGATSYHALCWILEVSPALKILFGAIRSA